MNKHVENLDGYIVFENVWTSSITCRASEKWFPTYDDAVEYAMDIVRKRTEEFKTRIDRSYVIIYEGKETLLYGLHSYPCGRVVFSWTNSNWNNK